MEYQLRNWYHFVWLCGDNIFEQHVHNLDVCNWVKSAHPWRPTAWAAASAADNRKEGGQIFDQHMLEFTYADGSKMYSQCRQKPNTWSNVSDVHGTKGTSNGQGSGHGGRNLTSKSTSRCSMPSATQEATTTAITAPPAALRPSWAHGHLFRPDRQVGRRRGQGHNEMPKRFALDADPPAMPDKDGRYPIPVPGIYRPFHA